MKNTKRSMLITTVLMVVVLVVAISTSTFAWYTASNTGSATTAVVTSASASDANIAVGWTDSATTTTIAFNTQTVSPMVPNAEPVADAESITFQTANISTLGIFGTPSTATPWGVQNAAIGTDTPDDDSDDIAEGNYNSFFVINHNVNAGVRVTMKAAISGDLADMLCIAVFVDGELKSVLTGMSAYRVGPITQGEAYTTLADSTALLTAATTGFTFDLTASGTIGNSAEITIAAWLDGESLVSSEAGKSAAFDFNFTAAPLA